MGRVIAELYGSENVRRRLLRPPRESHIYPNIINIARIKGIVVAREWRATGLARIIVKHGLSMISVAGAATIFTVATNPRVQHMLTGSGFEVLCEAHFRALVEREGIDWKPELEDPQSIQLMCFQVPVPEDC